jgi:hypothetical protein
MTCPDLRLGYPYYSNEDLQYQLPQRGGIAPLFSALPGRVDLDGGLTFLTDKRSHLFMKIPEDRALILTAIACGRQSSYDENFRDATRNPFIAIMDPRRSSPLGFRSICAATPWEVTFCGRVPAELGHLFRHLVSISATGKEMADSPSPASDRNLPAISTSSASLLPFPSTPASRAYDLLVLLTA